MGRRKGDYQVIKSLQKDSRKYTVTIPTAVIEDELGLKDKDKLLFWYNKKEGYFAYRKIGYTAPLPTSQKIMNGYKYQRKKHIDSLNPLEDLKDG